MTLLGLSGRRLFVCESRVFFIPGTQKNNSLILKGFGRVAYSFLNKNEEILSNVSKTCPKNYSKIEF